jgi:site-specific recombinase XerC
MPSRRVPRHTGSCATFRSQIRSQHSRQQLRSLHEENGTSDVHELRRRFRAKAYRGSRNLRAAQALLGQAEVATTERYTAVDDEIRAAAGRAMRLIARF